MDELKEQYMTTQFIVVRYGDEQFGIDIKYVDNIVRMQRITRVPKVQSYIKGVINLRGTVIPLIHLNEVLDNESTKKPDENLLVIIVKKGDKLAGLVVDELMGQQEIVIKSLGNYINKNKIISGATILGDGEIALILDTNALL